MKKIIIVLITVLLVGCSSTKIVKKNTKKEPLIYERPEKPFSNLKEDEMWYRVDYDIYNASEDKEKKVSVTLDTKINEDTLIEGKYVLKADHPERSNGTLLPLYHNFIDEKKDFIYHQQERKYAYLGDTPFFVLSEDNEIDVKKELIHFQGEASSEDELKNRVLEKSGSIITVENKYIHKWAAIYFIGPNGDIRLLTMMDLVTMIEYGVKDHRTESQSDESFNITKDILKLFNPEQFKPYLEEKYDIHPANHYISISDFSNYIMAHGAVLNELLEADNDLYFGLKIDNEFMFAETGDKKKTRFSNINFNRYENERTRKALFELLEIE